MPNLSDQEKHNTNDNPVFCPATELSSSELSFPTEFFYVIKDSLIKELRVQLAFLYSMITSLSVRSGYCFMEDKTFSKRMGVSLRTIERWMKQLEEKGFIYRNTFQTRQGKKRHIVTKTKFFKYWNDFLNRPCVPDEVKKDFIKKVFALHPEQKLSPIIKKPSNTNPETQPPKGPPDKNGGSYATAKNGGSILLRNSSNKKRERNGRQADPVVVVSFEEVIKKELAKMGIHGDRTTMAIKYYHKYKQIVDSKTNPMGWIIQGVRHGWLVDVLTKAKHSEEDKSSGKKSYPSPKPPQSPKPPPKTLSHEESLIVKGVVKKFAEKLVEEHPINIQITTDGFHWKSSKKSLLTNFHSYKTPSALNLLSALANSTNQEGALNFITKILSEDAYANL